MSDIYNKTWLIKYTSKTMYSIQLKYRIYYYTVLYNVILLILYNIILLQYTSWTCFPFLLVIKLQWYIMICPLNSNFISYSSISQPWFWSSPKLHILPPKLNLEHSFYVLESLPMSWWVELGEFDQGGRWKTRFCRFFYCKLWCLIKLDWNALIGPL